MSSVRVLDADGRLLATLSHKVEASKVLKELHTRLSLNDNAGYLMCDGAIVRDGATLQLGSFYIFKWNDGAPPRPAVASTDHEMMSSSLPLYKLRVNSPEPSGSSSSRAQHQPQHTPQHVEEWRRLDPSSSSSPSLESVIIAHQDNADDSDVTRNHVLLKRVAVTLSNEADVEAAMVTSVAGPLNAILRRVGDLEWVQQTSTFIIQVGAARRMAPSATAAQQQVSQQQRQQQQQQQTADQQQEQQQEATTASERQQVLAAPAANKQQTRGATATEQQPEAATLASEGQQVLAAPAASQQQPGGATAASEQGSEQQQEAATASEQQPEALVTNRYNRQSKRPISFEKQYDQLGNSNIFTGGQLGPALVMMHPDFAAAMSASNKKPTASTAAAVTASTSASTSPAAKAFYCVGVLTAVQHLMVVNDQHTEAVDLVEAWNDVEHPYHRQARQVISQLYSYLHALDITHGFISCFVGTYIAWCPGSTPGTMFLSRVNSASTASTTTSPAATTLGAVTWLQGQAIKSQDRFVLPEQSISSDAGSSAGPLAASGGDNDKGHRSGKRPKNMSSLNNSSQQGSHHNNRPKSYQQGDSHATYDQNCVHCQPSPLPVLNQLLCQGSSGLVYLGEYLGVPAVAKLFGPDCRGLAQHGIELQMLVDMEAEQGRLVPRLLAAGHAYDGVWYIATELVAGQDLSSYERVPEPVALAALAALKALGEAYPGFLHGDIRLQNVLVLAKSTAGRDALAGMPNPNACGWTWPCLAWTVANNSSWQSRNN